MRACVRACVRARVRRGDTIPGTVERAQRVEFSRRHGPSHDASIVTTARIQRCTKPKSSNQEYTGGLSVEVDELTNEQEKIRKSMELLQELGAKTWE